MKRSIKRLGGLLAALALLLGLAPAGLPALADEEAFRYLELTQPQAGSKPRAGDLLSGLDPTGLAELGLTFVDDRDPSIQYGWQYTHESTQMTPADAYGQTSRNDGWSLEPTITYTFEGTYIAVVMQAGPRVANHCFTLDGEPAGKVLPYSDGLHFAVVFAADDLEPGRHTLVISLEDGNSTDSNNPNWYAEFDAFIVGTPVAEGEPEPPSLVKDLPQTKLASTGGRITLRCEAEAGEGGLLTYQWLKDGTPIPGAAGPAYTLTDLSLEDAGEYQVKVVNTMGGKTAETASTPCGVTVEDTVYVPQLTARWSDSTKLVGENDGEFLSDFCLIQDSLDRWHAIGIGGQEGSDDKTFFHAVGEHFNEHYTYIDRVKSDGDQSLPDTGHMWAPYAVHSPDGNTYLYYHHYNEKEQSVQMRVLTPTDDTLEHWVPLDSNELEEDNILFRRGSSRDACIFWDEEAACWFMYYADGGIWLTTSEDLLHWSDSVKVLASAPKGFSEPESPFVIKRYGYYYLFVSGYDYGRVAVYRSADPRDFGNGLKDAIGELNGHAPEIITVDGQDYVACAGINEAPEKGPYPGGAPVETNISGVYLQKLDWLPEEEAQWLDVSLLVPEISYDRLELNPSPDPDAPPQAGDLLAGLSEERLKAQGLRFIDDTDPAIQYHWRYTHPSTQLTPEEAYGHTSKANGWALDPTIDYDFEGSSIAVIMQAGPRVAVHNFTIDGQLVEAVLPYADEPRFCVVFAAYDLGPGPHHLQITLDEGLQEEDWYAEFDAFIVGAVPESPRLTVDLPAFETASEGETVTLSVSAAVEGPGALTYQWYKDGALLPGAVGAEFRLEAVDTGAAGRYQVTVTNTLHGCTAIAESEICVLTVKGKETPTTGGTEMPSGSTSSTESQETTTGAGTPPTTGATTQGAAAAALAGSGLLLAVACKKRKAIDRYLQ